MPSPPPNSLQQACAQLTRRQFFCNSTFALGSLALAQLLAEEQPAVAAGPAHPLAPKTPHFPPRARSVIHLFMAGGPSQLELFDLKPKLQELHGQKVPAEFIAGKRFAFLKREPELLGTRRKFARHGQSGAEISECLPHLAEIADQVAIVKTLSTDVFNHAPAKILMNTGSPLFGRPSMGAWITYGLGSEADDLPGFVVLQSGPRGPRGGVQNYGSGFLSSLYQGVPLRPSGDPILNLTNPAGIDRSAQRRVVETLTDLNGLHRQTTGDDEIAARIATYEMAFRMQTAAPELIDFGQESAATLALYGAEPGKPSFANNCLLARRLVERGVRFVVLYHTDWDHHGGKGADLETSLDERCLETDRAAAALVTDLTSRGLIDTTLVLWGGEFGRTPMGENRETIGRDHHVDAFSAWLAGGGVKTGQTIGRTDDLGYYPVEDKLHVHDLQATILHLLGLDHLRLTYRFQGRDFRLTDVGGQVIEKLIA
ncbi:MAG: DUF1501 domain-containing protein [Pirellulales bacterium]|nr:DUF1501 domain-containing protein [Pirellulales bacterium]